MIKKYKHFESLLNKLSGPSDEEVWGILNKLSPKKMMFKSAEIGFLPGIKKAIENGANVTDTVSKEDYYGDYYDENILDIITNKGHFEIFDEIYKYFKTDNIKRDSKYLNSLLINVSRTNNVNFAKKLIEMGAKVYTHNNSALITASSKGNLEMVKLLLDNGAYIYADHNDALKQSIINNNTDVVKFLLEKGADLDDVNLRDYDFNTIFKNKNVDLFNLLIKNDLDVNEIFIDHTIMDLLGMKSYEMIKSIINSGFKISKKITQKRIKEYGPIHLGEPLDNSIIDFLKTNNIVEND